MALPTFETDSEGAAEPTWTEALNARAAAGDVRAILQSLTKLQSALDLAFLLRLVGVAWENMRREHPEDCDKSLFCALSEFVVEAAGEIQSAALAARSEFQGDNALDGERPPADVFADLMEESHPQIILLEGLSRVWYRWQQPWEEAEFDLGAAPSSPARSACPCAPTEPNDRKKFADERQEGLEKFSEVEDPAL